MAGSAKSEFMFQEELLGFLGRLQTRDFNLWRIWLISCTQSYLDDQRIEGS